MRTWGRRGALCVLGVLVLAGAAACSRAKKLSGEDDTLFDDVRYGVFGMDRDAADYYRIVKQSHESKRFGYRVTPDKFLIDKNVDAVQRLGKLQYDRLEGQAQVMVLLADVLLEDASSLAQTNAANSLTRLALRQPQGAKPRVPEQGGVFLALLREMDAMYAARGRATRDPAGANRRAVQIIERIGSFELPTVALAKDALKPFYTRKYLVDAPTQAMRQVADRALVRRMHGLARLALRGAIDDETAYVREEAVRGLKALRDTGAETVVLSRLAQEPDPRVRAEIVEYLGSSASAASVRALLPMLEDADPSLKYKARQSLTRIAGRDLGFRRVTWTRWAQARYPELGRPPAKDGPSQPADRMR